MWKGRGFSSKVANEGRSLFDVTLRVPSAENAMRSWMILSETWGSQEAGMSYHQRFYIDLSMKLLIQVLAEQKYEPIIAYRPVDFRGVPAKCSGCSHHSFLVIPKHVEPKWWSGIEVMEIDTGIFLA